MSLSERWYLSNGWKVINRIVTEAAARKKQKIYIKNFDVIPAEINQNDLIKIFNSDSSSWQMTEELDGELIIVKQY